MSPAGMFAHGGSDSDAFCHDQSDWVDGDCDVRVRGTGAVARMGIFCHGCDCVWWGCMVVLEIAIQLW